MDNKTKQVIINRLIERNAVCGFCKKRECRAHGYRELPDRLTRTEVLLAINLDEYYFKEADNQQK